MARGISALLNLYEEYERCTKCSALVQSRNQVVFGTGSAKADLMVIGEAPGADEDSEGVPFWGRSGRRQMEMMAKEWPESEELQALESIEIDEHSEDPQGEYFDKLRHFLDAHVFWTNVILCRPEDNREPLKSELTACKDRLHRTIYAVDPLLILATGATALSAVLGRRTGIKEAQGQIYEARIPSPVTGDEVIYPVMALLHPAFLLRTDNMEQLKRKKGDTYQTMQYIADGLALLDAHYMDVFDTHFPNIPEGYKS
jgi:uracil-DNA glycosylase family 4